MARATVFAFGACLGSFLQAVSCRIPEGTSIVFPGSRCPACATPLAWHENVPIFGWLLLRGRCGHCGIKIHMSYLLVEIAMAATALALYFLHVEGRGDPAGFCRSLALAVWLFTLSLTDIRHRLLPDALTLPPLLISAFWSFIHLAPLFLKAPMPTKDVWYVFANSPVALVLHYAFMALLFAHVFWAVEKMAAMLGGSKAGTAVAALFIRLRFYANPEGDLRWRAGIFALGAGGASGLAFRVRDFAWMDGASGALFAWALLWLCARLVGLFTKEEAIGGGDLKLAAALGWFLGFFPVLFALAGASLLGSAIGFALRLKGGPRQIPFGPFLALAAFAVDQGRLIFAPEFLR